MGKKDKKGLQDDKGGKIAHPADAVRRKDKKKRQAKVKEQRNSNFEKKLLDRSAEEIEAEINTLKQDHQRKRAHKIDISKYQLDHLAKLENNFKKHKEEIDEQTKKRDAAPKHTMHVNFEELKMHRKASIYYHPVNNPYGAPPNGQMLMYRHPDGSVKREPPPLEGPGSYVAAGGAESDDDDDDDDDDEAYAATGGGPSQASSDEGGDGVADWIFDREDDDDAGPAPPGRFGDLVKGGLISDTARAIAEVETEGKGNATSRQLVDAAREFATAEKYEEAADLLEVCRTRVDKEQLERKIDNATALARDDECMWALASAYEKDDRLTLAVNAYGILKDRLSDKKERTKATCLWAEASFALACRLDMVRRYEDAERLFLSILEPENTGFLGDGFREEVQLNLAMNLQNMWRGQEAIDLLLQIKSKGSSKKLRSQATFIMEVIQVGDSGERNEEFHKMWDDNFMLPSDGYSSGFVRKGSPRVLNLSNSEKKFRNWAQEYWQDRLSSPLYYAFLTLFVTWPFAIPVVSILGKEGAV